MHLHAIGADDQGPPPLKVGAPYNYFGPLDPRDNYGEVFIGSMKSGAWNKSSVTSPLTDSALQQQTLAVLEKRNIYAVCSGDLLKVRAYKAAKPNRIINSVYWDLGMVSKDKLTTDSLKTLFTSGEFKVFGEVAVQYEGISPSDTAVDPYLKLAEELDVPVGIHLGTGPPGVAYLAHSRASLGVLSFWKML